MNAMTENLLNAVRNVVASGPLAKAVRRIEIEPAIDEDDEEFLRVELLVRLPTKNVDSELEALLERIEEAVGAIDSRYPSVRFLDAA